MVSINLSPLLTELLVDSFSDFQIMQHNLSPLESHHITFEALVLMLYLLAMLALLTLLVQDDEYIEQPDRWRDMDVLLPKKKQDTWKEVRPGNIIDGSASDTNDRYS